MIAEHRAAHLVATSGQGQVDALAQLYDGVAGHIFAAAYRATGRQSVAEDIACEVMHRIWRQAPTFQESGQDAHHWIVELLDQALDLRALDRGEDPRPVDLSTLPAAQRDCLERAWVRGEALPEIAAELKLPSDDVARHLNEGLRTLAR